MRALDLFQSPHKSIGNRADGIIGDKFGNYTIRGIDEIVFPEPVSWMPSTVAWSLLAAITLAGLCFVGYRAAQRWSARKHRRSALQRIKDLQLSTKSDNALPNALLRELPTIMKATALGSFPRTDIAALHGEHWLQFLDNCYPGPKFCSDTGRALLRLAYQNESGWGLSKDNANQLISMCEQWLSEHKSSDRKC